MSHSEILHKKIFTKPDMSSMAELERKLAFWRFKEASIVFTNGCFDILHLGHIDYLSKASDLGSVLIVGLNNDRSVRSLKGPKRPINNENARAMVLAALSFIDAVILFDEDTPYELIDIVQPDVLVKGGDYSPENIVGNDIVKKKNGKIVTINFLEGFSTSLIEKKIQYR